MAIERYWEKIDPVAFTADGQENGVVTISDTFCFKVKMAVIINADGKNPKRFEIKRVLSTTQMILGPENESIRKKSDLSEYIMGINPTIEAPEQERPKIPPGDYERAAYEEEPVVAKRVINVDKYGNPFSENNPFPIGADLDLDVEFEQDSKGRLKTSDVLDCGGNQKVITVGDTPVPIRIGANNKVGRLSISARPKSKGIYWGYTSSVTRDDDINGGTEIFKNEFFAWDVDENTDIYLVGPASGVKVSITES